MLGVQGFRVIVCHTMLCVVLKVGWGVVLVLTFWNFFCGFFGFFGGGWLVVGLAYYVRWFGWLVVLVACPSLVFCVSFPRFLLFRQRERTNKPPTNTQKHKQNTKKDKFFICRNCLKFNKLQQNFSGGQKKDLKMFVLLKRITLYLYNN